MERNALEALASLLDRLGIHWMLIGALAANRYRITTRLTQDVDLLLADVGPGLAILERALGDAGWSLRRALPGGEILRLRHRELGAADLIVAGTDYERGALARAREERLGDAQEVRIAAPEDVIVLELIAGRASRSCERRESAGEQRAIHDEPAVALRRAEAEHRRTHRDGKSRERTHRGGPGKRRDDARKSDGAGDRERAPRPEPRGQGFAVAQVRERDVREHRRSRDRRHPAEMLSTRALRGR